MTVTVESNVNHTMFDVEGAAQAIYDAVMSDIVAGQVPFTVATYSELHDHVDANDFLEDQRVPWGTDLPERDDDPAGVRIVNLVTDRVDAMLVARAQRIACHDCGCVDTENPRCDGVCECHD